jgi:hypothetical protein
MRLRELSSSYQLVSLHVMLTTTSRPSLLRHIHSSATLPGVPDLQALYDGLAYSARGGHTPSDPCHADFPRPSPISLPLLLLLYPFLPRSLAYLWFPPHVVFGPYTMEERLSIQRYSTSPLHSHQCRRSKRIGPRKLKTI